MIKKIKIYITLAAVAFSSVSCLDKYPEDAIPEGDAIRTVEEANQAVIGIYAYMKNPNLYSGLLTLLPDLQADLAYAVGQPPAPIWQFFLAGNCIYRSEHLVFRKRPPLLYW